MSGGLSNVTLNETWAAQYHPDPLREYLRVSPTGPLVPLVFSTTTLGERLFIAMTYRHSLLSRDRPGQMLDAFIERLAGLAGIERLRGIVAPQLRDAGMTHAMKPSPGRRESHSARHDRKRPDRLKEL